MERMEFGNSIEGEVFYGIHFTKEELSILKKSLEDRLKNVKHTVERWSNPVYNPGVGIAKQEDLDWHRERALRELRSEIEEIKSIESLLLKI